MSDYTANVVEFDVLWSEILDLSSAELDLELHSLGISREKIDNSFAALESCAAFSSLYIELDILHNTTSLIPVCRGDNPRHSGITIAIGSYRDDRMKNVICRRGSPFELKANADVDLRAKIQLPASFPWHLHNS